METEPDLNLETDRLEQLLETPPPPQSVVVVEYRNRGVPTWIFFPLIVLVPLVRTSRLRSDRDAKRTGRGHPNQEVIGKLGRQGRHGPRRAIRKFIGRESCAGGQHPLHCAAS